MSGPTAGPLCAECVANWFTDRTPEQAIDWTLRQVGDQESWIKGKEARAEADELSLAEWLAR